MEKRKAVRTVGAGVVIGAAILGGIAAYKNRKALKRKKDQTTNNIVDWKNNRLNNALDKAENVIKDLRYSTITEKDIAWG